jgi:hypothetical protein
MKYDDKGLKWLRVKNWEEYQPSSKLFKKDARLPWIKDYTNKLDNVEYQQLGVVARYIYEGICLIAGTRPERTLPNDPAWIAQALHIRRAEHAHMPRTLITLVEHGFVIPIKTEKISEDEEVVGSEKAEEIGEGRREKEKGEGVSKLVSELVSESSPKTSGYETLSESSQTIVNLLYPMCSPKFESIEQSVLELEEVSKALTVSGWTQFFEWNRSHKPGQLVFRSLDTFLSGVIYALNDYTSHDSVSCSVCKPKGKGARA